MPGQVYLPSGEDLGIDLADVDGLEEACRVVAEALRQPTGAIILMTSSDAILSEARFREGQAGEDDFTAVINHELIHVMGRLDRLRRDSHELDEIARLKSTLIKSLRQQGLPLTVTQLNDQIRKQEMTMQMGCKSLQDAKGVMAQILCLRQATREVEKCDEVRSQFNQAALQHRGALCALQKQVKTQLRTQAGDESTVAGLYFALGSCEDLKDELRLKSLDEGDGLAWWTYDSSQDCEDPPDDQEVASDQWRCDA